MPLVLKEWPTDVVRSINNARNGLTAETDNFRIDEDMPYKVNRDARLEPVPQGVDMPRRLKQHINEPKRAGSIFPKGEGTVFKQICFFRKRPDMSMEEFMDYYENQHSQLSKRMGRAPSIPNAVRYVRRYLRPEKNPVTGEVIDPGFDCIMEIWWNSREDFENSQRIISDPERLPFIKEDEKKLFASHSNPVCSVEEYDSPMGPNGEMTRVELKYAD